MKMVKVLFAAAMAGVVMAGCDSKTETPAPTNSATQPSAGTPTPAEQVKSVTAATTVEAQKLIDQATDYVKNNKMDLADETIKKLEDMKANLPADYQKQVDNLRAAFNAAKTKMPDMPKIPGM